LCNITPFRGKIFLSDIHNSLPRVACIESRRGPIQLTHLINIVPISLFLRLVVYISFLGLLYSFASSSSYTCNEMSDTIHHGTLILPISTTAEQDQQPRLSTSTPFLPITPKTVHRYLYIHIEPVSPLSLLPTRMYTMPYHTTPHALPSTAAATPNAPT
jgi:hypothetical protein